jgi:hypothetical protein
VERSDGTKPRKAISWLIFQTAHAPDFDHHPADGFTLLYGVGAGPPPDSCLLAWQASLPSFSGSSSPSSPVASDMVNRNADSVDLCVLWERAECRKVVG